MQHVGHGWPLRTLIEGSLTTTGSGTIQLGDRVRLNAGVWLHCEPDGRMSIGAGSAIGRNSQLSCLGRVTIGSGVLLSPNVLVMDHAHGRLEGRRSYIDQRIEARGSITIEDDCWLGAYSCILSRRDEPLIVGKGSIIGAGAIVTSSVPPRSAVVGPIGRIVRTLDDMENHAENTLEGPEAGTIEAVDL